MENCKLQVVQLSGGIGNQMFQYAFAKALSKQDNKQVKLDCVTWFEKDSKLFTKDSLFSKDGRGKRVFELNCFPNLSIDYASSSESKFLLKRCHYPKIIRSILGINKYRYLIKEKQDFIYDKDLFAVSDSAYFKGYFQNAKYFEDIRADIISDFRFPKLNENDIKNRNLLDEIKTTKNSVFIHVRREDYVNLKMSIPIEYYKKAVECLKSKVSNPTFFIFCAEDPSYVHDNFTFLDNYELVGVENNTRSSYWINMLMMSNCNHAILANSSYSWWGAWLINIKDKIVIAPSPWLLGDSNIICNDWFKVHY